MPRGVFPDNSDDLERGIVDQRVLTALEEEFDNVDTQTQSRQFSVTDSEPTIVRDFTETFPRQEDIESSTHASIRHPGDNNHDEEVTPTPDATTTIATTTTTIAIVTTNTNTGPSPSTPTSQRHSEPSLIPFFRPNIVAVTAIPAAEDLYEGFENTPHGRWRSPIHKFWSQLYPSCLCSTIFPFLVIAQLNHKFRQQSFYSTLLYFIFGITFIVVGAVLFQSPYLVLLLVMPVIYYAFHLRQHVRKQFKLPGSAKSDCFFSFCFPTCVLAQVSR